jgi:adenine specific DNA methylase Mod
MVWEKDIADISNAQINNNRFFIGTAKYGFSNIKINNLAILHRNLEINSIKNVEVIPNAVGASGGTIKVSHSISNSYIL